LWPAPFTFRVRDTRSDAPRGTVFEVVVAGSFIVRLGPMTEEERDLAAVRHVVHDYVCLVSAGTSIYGNPRPPINSHVQYSFLVFCRKFGHFFMNQRGRGMNDMAALDFVGKLKFKTLLPTWFEWDRTSTCST
jgi:hypothetical protein